VVGAVASDNTVSAYSECKPSFGIEGILGMIAPSGVKGIPMAGEEGRFCYEK
jgi:hypothetical protein